MPDRKNKVLLCDDEELVRLSIRRFLERGGFEVVEATDIASAMERLHESVFDAALFDFMLPDGNALDLLPRAKELRPGMPVILLTGHASIDLAIRAVKAGAENFLAKPLELPAVHVMLLRAIENARNRKSHALGEARSAKRIGSPFLGTSAVIRELEELAHRVASSDRPVTITGETGSGKGVLAQWLHSHGPRATEPFVDLNCAGFSAELLESELFGHERGAFTGAVTTKVGLLEAAHRGTVFLDEIAEIDLHLQPKLLKVVEEQRLRRVGDVKARAVDFRLIAASHRDLAALAAQGKFRDDLFFRLSTLPLKVPPLRGRVEDIPLLARHILEQLAAELGRAELVLDDDTTVALQGHSWPGNIRELRNVLERAVLLNSGNRVARSHLRFDTASTPPEAALTGDLSLEAVERAHVERVLSMHGGRVDAAAKVLQVPLSSLYQRLQRYGLRRPQRAGEKVDKPD